MASEMLLYARKNTPKIFEIKYYCKLLIYNMINTC